MTRKLGPLPRGKVKTRGLRALEKANREFIQAMSELEGGGRRGLGELQWGPAPTVAARFFVGLDKGRDQKNHVGYCSTQPSVFTPEKADDRFMALRSIGVREANRAARKKDRKDPAELDAMIGASRISQRGVYKGVGEDSHQYLVIHDSRIPGERTLSEFAESMRTLADNLSATMCQDSVIVSFETPKKNTSEGRTGGPEDYKQAAALFGGLRGKRRRR